MDITEKNLQFCKLAILDIYNVKNRSSYMHYPCLTLHALKTLEGKICNDLKINSLFVADSVSKSTKYKHVRWIATVSFNGKDPFDTRYKIEFLPPVVESAPSLYTYCLDSDSMLYVKLKRLPNVFDTGVNSPFAFYSQYAEQYWAQMELIKNGITFGGRKYSFLGGEVEKAEQLGSSCTPDHADYHKSDAVVLAWFYAETTQLNIQQVRNYFGHLSILPAGKCNARIKLGFSLIYPMTIHDAQIIVESDIISRSAGNVMTDGCGLIAEDLAMQLPYAISHGGYHSLRQPEMPPPMIIQIRCVCKYGLFKGCLLVTADATLCPSGMIVFRESMRKAIRTTTSSSCPESILGVVETFEHPSILHYDKRRHNHQFQAKLNRPLCLLLQYLHAKDEYFLNTVEIELDPWMKTLQSHDRKKLYALARAFTQQQEMYRQQQPSTFASTYRGRRREQPQQPQQSQQQQMGQESVKKEPTDSLPSWFGSNYVYDEDVWDNIVENEECDFSYFDEAIERQSPQEAYCLATQRMEMSLGEKIMLFLLAGFSFRDPFFQQLWKRLVRNQFQYMRKLHFTVQKALYLVGAPDPYGILAPNEVYISFPGDRMVTEMPLNDELHYVGKVVVSRNPMLHPGDIRVFDAVHSEVLAKACANTNGGVIFFSVNGTRAPADEMSGGDYDGDKFIVLYATDSTIVKDIRMIPPYEEDAEEKDAKVMKDYIPAVSSTSTSTRATSEQEIDDLNLAALSLADCCLCPHTERFDACKLCTDPMALDILKGLLQTAQYQYVGRYSNAWLAYSDQNPLSKDALDCAKIVRIALDAAKSGLKISERRDLLRFDRYPDYLKSLKATTPVSSSSPSSIQTPNTPVSTPTTQTSPIRGALFATTSPLRTPSQTTFSSPVHSKTPDRGCKKSVITKIYEAINRLETTYFQSLAQDNGNELWWDWDVITIDGDDEWNNRWLQRRKQWCPLTCRFSEDPSECAFQLVSSIANHIMTLFAEYEKELNDWLCAVKRYKNQFANILKMRTTNRTMAMTQLLQEHIQFFQDRVSTFAQEHSLDSSIDTNDTTGSMITTSSSIARQRVACFVYIATYCCALIGRDAPKTPKKGSSGGGTDETILSSQYEHWAISYCWEICGLELRRNKVKCVCKRKQLQPITADPSELIYLQ